MAGLEKGGDWEGIELIILFAMGRVEAARSWGRGGRAAGFARSPPCALMPTHAGRLSLHWGTKEGRI